MAIARKAFTIATILALTCGSARAQDPQRAPVEKPPDISLDSSPSAKPPPPLPPASELPPVGTQLPTSPPPLPPNLVEGGDESEQDSSKSPGQLTKPSAPAPTETPSRPPTPQDTGELPPDNEAPSESTPLSEPPPPPPKKT